MTKNSSTEGRFRVADLPQNRRTRFELRPDRDSCAALARDLGLIALRKLSLTGELRALGKSDWQLDATLGATLVQPCVVSLAPVTTRLDIPVRRQFLATFDDPAAQAGAEEVEMSEDDSAEQLGAEIDVTQVMIESLALNLPLYPRAEDAEITESVFTEPGKQAMTDEEVRPFAGLAGLRDRLAGGEEDEGGK
ncbi:DUF177 domain-containing protein [Shimia sp.]|uniref:YceD family protein n=1 Tax=Shimia sp. TaxID=1954381 RepID=UPI0035695E53